MLITRFIKFKQVYELNHQSIGVLGVNDPGFGQGAHVGNWGADYGNPSQGVRGTFGKKSGHLSDNIPQGQKPNEFSDVVYDPYTDTYLMEDEVKDLLSKYTIKCNQNSETPQKFSKVDSKTIEFIQKYLEE